MRPGLRRLLHLLPHRLLRLVLLLVGRVVPHP